MRCSADLSALCALTLVACALSAQTPTPGPTPTPAQAAPPRRSGAAVLAKDVIFGVKAGVAMPGVMWVDDSDFDLESGLSVSAFVDYRLAPKLFGTLSLHVSNMDGDFTDVESMRDVTMQLKALVGAKPESQFAFRPTFGFGWGTDGDVNLMMLHAFLEIIPLRASRAWVVDAGIFGAPVGGNDDFDVSIEPRFVLRLGVLF